MDRNRMKRRYLPLVHAVFNSVAVLLALAEVVTGIGVIRVFMLS
jgi:hypothetical protein